MSYNYRYKGNAALVLPNAMEALKQRGWYIKGMLDYTMMVGIVDFEFGENGSDSHHIALSFKDGEQIGFPPEYVKIID